MPCDAGRFHKRRLAKVQIFRQGTQHPGGQIGVAAEGAVCVRIACRTSKVGAPRREVWPVLGVPDVARCRGGRVDSHRRARCRTHTIGCLLEDNTNDLVAEDHRFFENGLARGAVQPVMEVRTTDPAIGNLHDGLVGLRCCQGDVLDAKIAFAMGYNCRTGCREDDAHQTTTVIPPSTKIVWPFTKFDACDASHTVGPARSAVVPHLLAGVRPRIQELKSASSTRFCVISVWM
ncbi:hypothetical protein PJL18_02195 [Paenarthrobacter nicotinovorans]|nr:hypothetical protein [Paenarthrobacter nicotinovorans]